MIHLSSQCIHSSVLIRRNGDVCKVHCMELVPVFAGPACRINMFDVADVVVIADPGAPGPGRIFCSCC